MQLQFFPEIIKPSNTNLNKLKPGDKAFHDWYRFVLSYPPHLVRDYLKQFELPDNATVLDPFCGTGTTLVEAKKRVFVLLVSKQTLWRTLPQMLKPIGVLTLLCSSNIPKRFTKKVKMSYLKTMAA